MIDARKMTMEPSGEREIVIKRVFDAPRDLVFDAWTKPALLKRWMGLLAGWSWKTCKIDLRVGGAYRYVWQEKASGKEMGLGGTYREIVRPDRIRITEKFDEAWYPGEGQHTVTFTEHGPGRTLLTMTLQYESAAARDGVLKSPAEKGIALGYANLDGVLADAARAEVQKVAFTMFAVENAERARAFYEKTLGLHRGSASPEGTWTEYDLPGGGCLALFMNRDQPGGGSGGASIAFEVRDLDALTARLKSEGVRVQAEGIQSPVCRMNVILDTEGNTIVLHQLHAPG